MSPEVRYRLSRGGILNVWQYDRQTFDFAGGRLLLRGANGAGKSKTMEMLLPFVVDGDKGRLTASGKHHTSLLWLMLDGHEGSGRTGYVWVEFTLVQDGRTETVTCGVGMRATQSARTATSWFFTSPCRVGDGLELEDESGPLSHQRLKAEVEADGVGRVFESAKRYREHVGRLLFGLPVDQYDELLRLLYWLRQPQVGEDIDPKRLAEQLVNALPQVDDSAIRSAGDTFDELEAFGEQLERRGKASAAISSFVETYAVYARCVVVERADQVIDADRHLRTCRRGLRQVERELRDATVALATTDTERTAQQQLEEEAHSRIGALEAGPEARTQQRLMAMGRTIDALADLAAAAERHTTDASRRAESAANRAAEDAGRLTSAATSLHAAVHSTGRALLDQGVPVRLGALAAASALGSTVVARGEVGVAPEQESATRPPQLRAALGVLTTWVSDCQPVLGERRATLQVVRSALERATTARGLADRAEEAVAGAETAAESASAAAQAAAEESQRREGELVVALSNWRVAADAVPFEVPDLTATGLSTLEHVVHTAADPERRRWSDLRGRTRGEIDDVQSAQEEFAERRRAVEAEVDPTPTTPSWRRESREGREGAPFWKLVDFRPEVTDADRAGLEAALEGAGILDAWVEPDGHVTGRLLDASLTLSADTEAASTSLAAVLRPDVGDLGVRQAVVGQVLDGLVLRVAGVAALAGATVIGADGTWRIGPVTGRTTKDVAQHIGVTARAAERRRRLSAIDEQLADLRGRRTRLEATLVDATGRLERLDAWLSRRPRHDMLLQAWATQETRDAVSADRRRDLDEATRQAVMARAVATDAHAELSELAAVHDLPTTAEGLDARSLELADLGRALEGHHASSGRLGDEIDRWERSVALEIQEGKTLLALQRESSAARSQHWTAAAERDELARTEGASLAELDRRLAELREERDRAAERGVELNRRHDDLMGRLGHLRHRVDTATIALQAAEPVLEEARASFARLSDVPGVALAAGVVADDGSPVPMATLDVATTQQIRTALGTGLPASESAKNAVFQGSMSLQNGPAATNEPRLVEQDGVLVSVGRDDSGDLPVVVLDRRLAASVAQDRDLLSQRERELFEKHILGQLGDALRSVRIKAAELVTAMNDQLRRVTTSQGIRVKLRWTLRDDIPAEARRAVELLEQPLGAMLPDERAELRGALHALIDASRDEAPEESYAGHLARALDYRRWYAFQVQYHRPEAAQWRDLQRKSPLSQGEQKVLCYLPLFAAAAAHFASLAGAAPYAPRFVLLDDAFPKIDTRTHPLLFGLLVDLDLDFVITSERLWGTHATVPELAIYEALRSPTERGIAQYQHRWDGHRLSAVGA